MSIDNGGSAFPIPGQDMQSTGMTLRDYFAAKAMQALISDPGIRGTHDEFAKQAYKCADAMLRAR